MTASIWFRKSFQGTTPSVSIGPSVFPYEWECVSTLLTGGYFVDSSPFCFNDNMVAIHRIGPGKPTTHCDSFFCGPLCKARGGNIPRSPVHFRQPRRFRRPAGRRLGSAKENHAVSRKIVPPRMASTCERLKSSGSRRPNIKENGHSKSRPFWVQAGHGWNAGRDASC